MCGHLIYKFGKAGFFCVFLWRKNHTRMKRRLLRIVGGLLILPFLLSTHCDDEYDDFPSNGIQVDENIYRLENVSFDENGVLVGIGEQNVRFELWLSLADGTAVSNRFMLAQARDAAFNIEASSGAINLRTSLTGDDALSRAVKGTIEAARSD